MRRHVGRSTCPDRRPLPAVPLARPPILADPQNRRIRVAPPPANPLAYTHSPPRTGVRHDSLARVPPPPSRSSAGSAATQPPAAAPSAPPPPKFEDFDKVVKGAKEYDGLFKLYQKDDHLYAEIKPRQFDRPFLCPIAIARGGWPWAATPSTSTSSGC